MGYRPCGVYHQYYRQDHAWWQTKFVWGKMILLSIIIFYLFPKFAGLYYISVANVIGYTILSAMGVQLLIGYCGQVTLGHSAFLAVGAYLSDQSLGQYGDQRGTDQIRRHPQIDQPGNRAR